MTNAQRQALYRARHGLYQPQRIGCVRFNPAPPAAVARRRARPAEASSQPALPALPAALALPAQITQADANSIAA